MECGLIQGFVIDGVRTYTQVCVRDIEDKKIEDKAKKYMPVILLSKKSLLRGFSVSRKSVCPVIFKRKITLRPVIF